jgi:tRNA U55 pseudouridine synthase TruB
LGEIKKRWLIPPTKALSSFPAITVDDEISWKVSHGNMVTYGDLQDKVVLPPDLKGKIRILNLQGEMIAMAEIEGSLSFGERNLGKSAWRLLRVFNFEMKNNLAISLENPPLTGETPVLLVI